MDREHFLEELVKLQYTRNDVDLKRSTFRVRGDVVDVHPSHRDYGVKVEFDGNQIGRLTVFDIVSGDMD